MAEQETEGRIWSLAGSPAPEETGVQGLCGCTLLSGALSKRVGESPGKESSVRAREQDGSDTTSDARDRLSISARRI